ncbi:MAG: isochorismatase family protein [Bacteroidales bacterium]|jgi:nicotinamidase-related amidase|nr:isochorismatase family protein [Bacteroidales bacterium]
MKKLTTLLAILLMVISIPSFAQDKTEKPKEPIKPALLVIDIQKAFMPMMSPDKEIAMEYINSLIDLFRKHGYPVIRVYHTSEEYGVTPGTEGFEYPETVKILPTDPKVLKTYADGFNKTDLDNVIKATGSNTLFLCGLSAVGCVLATWIGAQDHDYKAFMVKNAIISHNSEYTRNVEQMFDAVTYDVVQLIIENTGK